MYARYTEVLKDLMDNELTKDALNKALSTYPLYQSKKVYDLIPTRDELNKKILNHYKYREIGFETVGRFLDELEITMCEIMPLYNERFRSIAIMADIEDPFATVDYTEEYTEEAIGETAQESSGTNKGTSETTGTGQTNGTETASNQSTSNSTSNQTNTGKRVHSETPQDSLSITGKNIDSVPYADDVEWNKDEGTDTSNSTASGSSNSNSSSNSETSEISKTNGEVSSNSSGSTKHNVHHKLTKKGAMGVTTFGHDMIEFRTSFIDVMDEIINDERLNELFMNVW